MKNILNAFYRLQRAFPRVSLIYSVYDLTRMAIRNIEFLDCRRNRVGTFLISNDNPEALFGWIEFHDVVVYNMSNYPDELREWLSEESKFDLCEQEDTECRFIFSEFISN